MDIENAKFAVTDTHMRTSSLVGLTKFNDQQAMSLLQLYVTVGLAALAGALATADDGSRLFGWPATVGLGVFAVAVFSGAVLSHLSMKPCRDVPFAGGGADWWLWALRDGAVDMESALLDALERANEKQQKFLEFQRTSAKRLTRARQSALIGLAGGAIAGVLTAIGGACL
ncbi:hypothetical protein L0F51_04105 [Afifella sp. H1R]|uniref:hypothetical protein n=1 Tax=Afifella sp. H1R TaxID=2908841 RepID=UPI001F485AB3|nr:hypothetical protein [Afifella sp. H1R]MCF1502948.1 hypothetical protein [Afifella sp. H1R]